ncbi:zinc finger protein GAI-ASSOCIATED FACTOR 1-like [Salvia miltiorrhiza]|uniref:zinc finger protein GAI-ASSOCIATED FACTOR 1-like n=1 Tax=Salvia miltiorrhiza TaxID=226208 RepID=UPI0025AD53C7|nr:zinc finger protein GAI-ASSOCIATED FACTOR 1-like [Salvia miltiorrhiza]
MSNITGDEGSFSSGEVQQQQEKQSNAAAAAASTTSNGSSGSHKQLQPAPKKKRNLPGTPDPTAEVVALSPTTLMATNRFVCEICNKGFQRDQNLQLHRRGHNLPWKLRQRTTTEVKKRVYICPEPTCVHHNPGRALGDLTGIKKHYSRKHGEKKWKCDKCSKKYAVQSDWKAHQKTCGTREYKCDCGTIFSRRDSFITHRAFCDALAEENNKVNQGIMGSLGPNLSAQLPDLMSTMPISSNTNTNTSMAMSGFSNPLKSLPQDLLPIPFKPMNMAAGTGMFSSASGNLFGSPRNMPSSSSGLQLSSNSSPTGYNYHQDSKNLGQIFGSAQMSATALLQKAAQMGATATNSPMMQKNFVSTMAAGPAARPGPYENFHGEQFNGGFAAQLMQKGPQELFEGGADMVMYGGMLMDQNINPGGGGGGGGGFLKNMVEGSGVEMNGNDMTTVDFLGVGGSRVAHDQINQQRMQVMQSNNPFHHHHAESDVDNTF